MYKLMYPSITVRTAPPVSVRVIFRVLVFVLRCNAIAHTVLHVSPRLFDLTVSHGTFRRLPSVLQYQAW